MSRIAVVYQSKAGSTEQYAKWLADDLGADLLKAKKVAPAQLEPYDTVVFGAPIYVGKLSGGAQFFEKNGEALKGKKLVFFVVGMSGYDDETFAKVKKTVFDEAYADVPTFFCRGAWDESKMTFADKAVVKMLKSMLKKKDSGELNSQEAVLSEVIGTKQNWVDRTYLDPIIEAAKG